MLSFVKVFDLTTGLYQFDFPLDIGSVVGFSGEKKHSEIFYKFSSMITPGIIYRVDMAKGDPPKAELFLGWLIEIQRMHSLRDEITRNFNLFDKHRNPNGYS